MGVWLSGRASALHLQCAEGPDFDHPLLHFFMLYCISHALRSGNNNDVPHHVVIITLTMPPNMSRCILISVLIQCVFSSLGDRLPEFQECVTVCEVFVLRNLAS